MKFRVAAPEFAKVLGKIVGVVPQKSTLAILESLHLSLHKNTLTITGTDLELAMSAVLEVEGERNGALCIPARRLADIVRVLPAGPVTLDGSAEQRRVTLSWPLGQFRLACEPVDEFPSLTSLSGEDGEHVTVDAALFKNIVHTVLFAVSTDELRPAMMGVLFAWRDGALHAVSTDGHRLVRVVTPEMPRSAGASVVVPSKALGLLGRVFEADGMDAVFGSTHVRFVQGPMTVSSRVIDEQYPNYESVIPLDNDRLVRAARRSVMESLRRVLLVANSLTHQVRLKLGAGTIQISAEDVDAGHEGREDVPCRYDGPEMDIGFNGTLVEEALSHLDGEEIEFAFSTPTRACIIRPAEAPARDRTLMLVMPVRLNA